MNINFYLNLKKERVSKGRFSKNEDDGLIITFDIPPFKRNILWIFIVISYIETWSPKKIIKCSWWINNLSIFENGNRKLLMNCLNLIIKVIKPFNIFLSINIYLSSKPQSQSIFLTNIFFKTNKII